MNPVARRYRHSSFTSQQRLLLQKSPSYAEADCQHHVDGIAMIAAPNGSP